MMPHSKLYKVILAGMSGTGKSNILSKYVNKLFHQTYVPTFGVEFFAKTISVDQVPIKLQIWDTAGNQKFKSITTSYYNGGNIILFVFDLASAESFAHIKRQIGQKFNMLREKNSDCTAVLVGNKRDLEGRQVNLEEAQKVGQLVGRYIEISTKTGQNLEQLFIQATRDKLNYDNKVGNQSNFIQNVKNIIEIKTLQELGNKYSQFKFDIMPYIFSNQKQNQSNALYQPAAPGAPSQCVVQTKAQLSEEDYKVVKIALTGSQKTGKTTIFSNYLFQKPVQQYLTTIGVDFGVKKVNLDNKGYKLQVWDTAGQERFKVIIQGYLINLIVAFVVYDKSNPASFQNAKSLIQIIKEKNQNPYICLVGNKNDLEQKVTYWDGIKLSEQMKVDFIEICANKLENVENLFARAIKVVHENNLVG